MFAHIDSRWEAALVVYVLLSCGVFATFSGFDDLTDADQDRARRRTKRIAWVCAYLWVLGIAMIALSSAWRSGNQFDAPPTWVMLLTIAGTVTLAVAGLVGEMAASVALKMWASRLHSTRYVQEVSLSDTCAGLYKMIDDKGEELAEAQREIAIRQAMKSALEGHVSEVAALCNAMLEEMASQERAAVAAVRTGRLADALQKSRASSRHHSEKVMEVEPICARVR